MIRGYKKLKLKKQKGPRGPGAKEMGGPEAREAQRPGGPGAIR